MKKIEQLKRDLIRYCYWYYVKAKPLISDYDFDMLFKELQKLEDNNTIPDSPTQMIYGDLESQYPDWAKNKLLGEQSDDQS